MWCWEIKIYGGIWTQDLTNASQVFLPLIATGPMEEHLITRWMHDIKVVGRAWMRAHVRAECGTVACTWLSAECDWA